jgi:Flp pilus assembly protein TadG
MPTRRSATTEHGSAAVEFALVLPLLLMVALALLQLGLLVRDRLMVEAAARAGARAAAVVDDDFAIRDAAIAAGPGLDPSVLVVEVARSGARGMPVSVVVRYASSGRIPLVAWLFPDPVSMSSSVTARQEFG